MVKAFSVASWNVEHFKNDPNRMERVFKFITENSNFKTPDIFGIYEVVGKNVYETLTTLLPEYTFYITYGPQSQEILVGARSNMSVFFTQKTEFQSGVQWMRPGAAVTIKVDDVPYNLLFLHLASLTLPRGWGLRDDMLERAVKFRTALFKIAKARGEDKTNYIFLGDLNTMGLEYPYGGDINASTVLMRWDNRVTRYYNMRRLTKTVEATYWGGSHLDEPASNLDHAFATKHLKFREFNRKEVLVTGWVDEDVTDRDTWTSNYSDHSLLFFEVQKV
jgi:hypothetical protein